MIEKLITSKDCLSCIDPCCRFAVKDSSYAPMFSKKERALLLKKGFPKKFFKKRGKFFQVKLLKNGKGLICPFVSEGKKCKIHAIKPLECRLWPFLLLKKNSKGKVFLGFDSEGLCNALEKKGRKKLLSQEAKLLCKKLSKNNSRLVLENPQALKKPEQGFTILAELH